MNHNDIFSRESVKSLELHLTFAMLEIIAGAVENVQVIISGDGKDVDDVRVSLAEEGNLRIEQPAFVLKKNLTSDKWMQITIRIPADWFGNVEAHTVSSNISVRGVSGDELTLETSSGSVTVKNGTFGNAALQSISGDFIVTNVTAEDISFRNVSGSTNASDCAFRRIKQNSVSGTAVFDLLEEVKSVDCNTVSGNVVVYTPQEELATVLRSMSGRIVVSGIDIVAHGGNVPVVNMTSVSGRLEMRHVEKKNDREEN